MMCIALRGGYGNEYWEGYRSVEIISYHPSKENPRDGQIKILFCLFLKNKRLKNVLNILHPGNVHHKLIETPYPFPLHQDEPINEKNINGILTSIYGRAFNKEGDKLYHLNCLSAWDSWYGNGENEEVTIWPSGDSSKGKMVEVGQVINKDNFIPFTEFKLGPFIKTGPVLIAFQMRFEGETYQHLIGGGDVFTVDGPESLVLRIKRDYITNCEYNAEKADWENRIIKFDKVIGFGESYDVILMNPPYSSEVKCIWKSGIVEGAYQPKNSVAKRYITAYPRFILALQYVKASVAHDKIAGSKVL